MVKKSTIKLSGVSISCTRKNFQSNLIFVVAFVPESQELKVSYNDDEQGTTAGENTTIKPPWCLSYLMKGKCAFM